MSDGSLSTRLSLRNRNRRPRARKSDLSARRLFLEPLEDRRLLAVAPEGLLDSSEARRPTLQVEGASCDINDDSMPATEFSPVANRNANVSAARAGAGRAMGPFRDAIRFIAMADAAQPDVPSTTASTMPSVLRSGSGVQPRAQGDLVGVDFDVASGVPPANWTLYSTVGSVLLTNLIDESGVPTDVDLNIVTSGHSFDTFTPNAAELPQHSQSLAGIDGNLFSSQPVTLTFEDLTAGAAYEVYVFGGDVLADTQSVTVTGADSTNFVQAFAGNQLFVNDEPGDAARTLMSFAEVITADGNGEVAISITPTTTFLGVAGVAIRPVDTSGASIHGRKWDDLDGDGVQDPGEPGLAGVTIYLDQNNNEQLDAGEMSTVSVNDDPGTTSVDETGMYWFNDLAAGTYTVREIVPSGYEQTYPVAGGGAYQLLGISVNDPAIGATAARLFDIDTSNGTAGNARDTGLAIPIGVSRAGDGTLYTIDAVDNVLYALDATTGNASAIGSLGLDIVEGDLDFHPATGVLYAMEPGGGSEQIVTINTSTGQAAIVGTLSPADNHAGMAFDAGGTLFVYGVGISSTDTDTLYIVDESNGAVVSSVPVTGGNLGAIAGMDFDPTSGVLYVADGATNGTDSLYTLNPVTGLLTLVGPTGVTGGLSGLEFIPLPAVRAASLSAPAAPAGQARPDVAAAEAAQRAANLDQYSTEQLNATREWVVAPAGRGAVTSDAAAFLANTRSVRGFTIWTAAEEDENPVEVLTQAKAEGWIDSFYPLVARQHSTRLIPNDPLFAEQWHLRNTGQSGGTPGIDANVTPAWDSVTGNGVVIGIVDDGLQYTHPDLDDHYLPAHSFDFNNNDTDPAPDPSFDWHGTSVAGVAAAAFNNNLGVSGSAPNAGLAGLRLIAGPVTDLDEANALSFHGDDIDIYSNSWGPFDNSILNGPGPMTLQALADGVQQGRGGLGSIYTWAAGNGLGSLDNTNYDGYANSRYTIAVAAIDHHGVQAFYSEPGAPILVTAPSDGSGAGIVTTDILGSQGANNTSGFSQDYTDSFGGTSSATPLVSGVIALMLEANPNLTWRDVQHVLVNSAFQNDAADSDWLTNGAGHLVNHKYGFGAIDAAAAVSLAQGWANVGPEVSADSGTITVSAPIPDNNPTGVSSTITMTEDITIESVEVVFDATHTFRGDLEVVLTSPSGTQSVLAELHGDDGDNYTSWVFTSMRHWDESSLGDWTLEVRDLFSTDTGTLNSWRLVLNGTSNSSGGDGSKTPGDGFWTVQLGPTSVVEDVDFGNHLASAQGASIHGRKWEDLDGDGVQDAGEPGLAGVTIYLDINDNGQIDPGEPFMDSLADDPVTTGVDETGLYWFDDVSTGTHIVREIVPAGYEQTYPTPAASSEFHIEVNFTDGNLTPSQQAIFTTAAARWAEIITGDVPDVGAIDDVRIDASAPVIDGPGGILGQAGPTNLRSGSSLPYTGIMQFDSADVANLEAAGEFDEVILHEMGHVLGLGTIWSTLGLLDSNPTNPRFLGAGATAEYNALFGVSEASVPVENDGGGGTALAHWEESDLRNGLSVSFNNELMTGFLNSGQPNPISRVTVAQFGDLGYQVNLSAADPFTPSLVSSRKNASPSANGRILALPIEEARRVAGLPASSDGASSYGASSYGDQGHSAPTPSLPSTPSKPYTPSTPYTADAPYTPVEPVSRPVSRSAKATSNLIVNGGFETGDFSGWIVTDSTGGGAWVINNGSFAPISGRGPLPPLVGGFDAVSDQSGNGIRSLSQSLVVPSGVTSAALSWLDRIHNFHSDFVDPQQEFRVSLRDSGGSLIQEIFSTNPGDATTQPGPNPRSFDVTASLQAHAGETIRLVFEQEDNFNFFNATVDDVVLTVSSAGGTKVPGDGFWTVTVGPGDVVEDVDFGNHAVGAADDAYEENDLPAAAADPLNNSGQWERTPLSSIDGLGIANDDDWYLIEVPPEALHVVIDATFSHSGGDIDLALLNADGSQLLASATSVSDNEHIEFEVSAAGTYLVVVYPFSGTGNTYDLIWSADDAYEQNDSAATAADPLGNGGQWEQTPLSSIDGLAVASDSDWYAIDVSAGSERVIIDATFSHAGGDIDLQLYNADGSQLLATAGSTTDNEQIDFVVPAAGTYLIRVFPFSGSQNSYDLVWDDVSATVDLVEVRLETTDLAGNVITQVTEGESFLVRGFVEDLRPSPLGVFAAYMDVTYPSNLASFMGPITYGPEYPNGSAGTGTAGLLDEIGAFDGDVNNPGGGEFLLFSVPMTADAAGLATFASDPADVFPQHETLLYGVDDAIPVNQIVYGDTTIEIIAAPQVRIDVQLVPVLNPTASLSTSLPTALTSSPVGGEYYVEVWLQNVGAPANGLTGGRVDVNYTTALLDSSTAEIFHQDFDATPSGVVDDAAGLVDNLGGGTLATDRGIDPQWTRLAYFRVTATAQGTADFSLDQGDLQLSIVAFGNVLWSEVDLTHTAIVEHLPSAQLDLTVVRTPSATDANGETAALPASDAWIHEWEPYFVEVWASTPNVTTTDVVGAMLDLNYNTALTTATQIQFGPAFGQNQSGTINDAAGVVTGLGAVTATADLGDDGYVLVARVLFEPVGADQAEVDEVNHFIGPYDLNLSVAGGQIDTGSGAAPATSGPAPATDLWSVVYDIDDNNQIDFGDFSFFSPAFDSAVGGPEPAYRWWADFDKSGHVDFGDFAFFTPNFDKSRPSSDIIFPPNFPAAWSAANVTAPASSGTAYAKREGEAPQAAALTDVAGPGDAMLAPRRSVRQLRISGTSPRGTDAPSLSPSSVEAVFAEREQQDRRADAATSRGRSELQRRSRMEPQAHRFVDAMSNEILDDDLLDDLAMQR